VLLGEYAVLDSSPCLVAALEHGVECTLTEADGPRHISTPADDRFVAACLNELGIDSGSWQFSDWNPLLLGGKPGFGGSAAATVVATLAGNAYLGNRAPTEDLHRRAAATHHRVQGSGSGVDIAAAVYGGFLEFTAGAVSPRPQLPVVAVWSGQSARTGPRVESYLRWAGRSAFAADMEALVRDFYGAPIQAMNEGYRLLCAMAKGAGIPYQTETLTAIYDLATTYGGAAKPSGAGGGDCAVAIFDSTERQHDFEAACTRRGFSVIPVSVAGAAAELPLESS
jgi:phosphomevalonate kinase